MSVWLPHNLKCFKLFTALGVGHVLLNWLAVVTACSLLTYVRTHFGLFLFGCRSVWF
jgi:hypothetical protein